MILQAQDRSQMILFGSLDNLIHSKHHVRIIDELIKMIMLKYPDKYQSKGGAHTGRPAYSTETMLKIFIYGYINRITSSRRLEQETHRNIELIWLTGNMRPDHKTIANFRKDNKEIIKEFCKDIKLFFKANALIDGSAVAFDGTKLKAYASRDMFNKDDVIARLKELEQELEQYICQIEEQDKIETDTLEQSLLPEKEKQYQEKITHLEQEIDNLKTILKNMKDKGRKHFSETDPDCNKMKSRDGTIPGYNVQIATDTENKFIVNESVTDEANDINQLKPALEALERELSITPEIAMADSGYCNFDIIQKIEKNTDTVCFIPPPREQIKNPNITFTYDEENDRYICSQGQFLTLKHRNKKAKNSYVDVYVGQNCHSCPLKCECTSSKTGRHISRFWNHGYRQEYRQRMQEPHAAQASLQRKSSIEHVFGTLKTWLGKNPLLTRGIENVTTEIKLFSSSYNIKRLLSIFSFDRIMAMIKSNITFNCQRTRENTFFLFNFRKYWLLNSLGIH